MKAQAGVLVLLVLFLIAVWWAVTASGLIDPFFLPGPGATFASLLRLFSGSFFTEHVLPSVRRVMIAYLLSALIAFPLGVLASQYKWASQVIQPLCGFSRYLPVATLVPLCILWFGIDDAQKIALIALGVVFQLILLIANDTASVPGDLVESGRTFGLSHFEIIRRIVIPWAMPSIWNSLRIAAGWAWSYLVLAELVSGNQGVGYFVIQSQRYLEISNVFAGIVFIGLLGLLTDYLFRLAGARMFRWN